jgi:hypothetical protein
MGFWVGRRDVKWPGFEDSNQGKMVMMSEHVFVVLFVIEMIVKVRSSIDTPSRRHLHRAISGQQANAARPCKAPITHPYARAVYGRANEQSRRVA